MRRTLLSQSILGVLLVAGCGLDSGPSPTAASARFEAALAASVRYLDRLLEAGFPMREVNVGGGLGRVARGEERPVDLDAYAAVVARHLGPYGVTAAFEPGDFVMKDAAVLLGEVVTVERRGDTTFVGLDIGWNVNCSYFIYR